MIIAAALKHMLAAGMDHDAIVAAVADMEANAPKDAQAERRRQADKERKRLRKSAESAESAEVVPSPKKETSPAPLKEKTTPSSEPNGSSKKPMRLPADFQFPAEWRAWAINAGLPADRCDLEFTKLTNWAANAPSSKGAKLNWFKAWQNWVLSAIDALPKARGSPPFAKSERPDHFANYTRELIDGQDRSHGSDRRDWDDAQGVPVLAIDYERR